ncbi:glycosyltransferase family 2 protein [Halpernia sp.]|uniref:glycosyltransferase family 2 protein n=1 Tax=Halpernia sp. TaxID=2782209 RepID=UPI003A9362EE
MQSPLISVVVPCYNQAQYLDECLQSVLDQTFTDWECIIVNDGSPDNTEEIAQKWSEKDSRFKYLYKENGGLSSARNAGIESAKGEWILPLDCDDKISNDYLEIASREFSKNYTIIYCEAEYFGEKSGKIPLGNYDFNKILLKNMIFCTAFFRKKNWVKVGGYDEKMIYGYEDWEFWIAILKDDIKNEVFKIMKTCFFYRIKENSMLLSLNGRKSKLMIDYISSKHNNLFIETFGNYIQILKINDNLERQLSYYHKSKLHRLIDKFLKFYYGKLKRYGN